ncbi:MAG: NB-ARC domain-containing protein, partial [Cyanobacteria bacterium J06642_11]
MAPNDQPFIPLAAGRGLGDNLHNYCSPLDTVTDGVLDDHIVEQIQHNLLEYLMSADMRYQLPPDLSSFAGRQIELETVMTRLMSAAQPEQSPSTVVFSINGRAGIGKSALVVHAAHQLKHFFPDAQLYLNLHGSESHPLSLKEALSALLGAWDKGDGWLPTTLDERLALYHSILADKRALIILDDVGDAAQIEPLIPKGGHCGILITSRNHLEGLAITDQLTLVEMNEEDGLYLLLRSSIGNQSVSIDVKTATQIVNLCSRNPLAIQLAASTLQNISSQQLLTYRAQLAAEKKKLALFNTYDLTVRASFSLSYQELGASCAKLFRRLGLFAQPTLTDAMAKMLLASDLENAKMAISHLVKRRLLKPINQNCYQFQPLLRLIAKEKLAQIESSQQRQSVRMRIIQWYLKMAEERALVFHPTTRTLLVQRISEQSPMLLPEGEQTLRLFALRWFEAERLNLMACINWAYQAEAWDMVIQFAKHLVIFYSNGMHWQDWEQSHQLALEAAQKLGDQQLEAQISNNLGNSFLQQSCWEKARDHYEASLSLLQKIGDLNGEAQTLLNLSVFYHLCQEDDTASLLRKAADEIRFANTSPSPPSYPQKKSLGRRNGSSTKLDASKSVLSPMPRDAYVVIGCIVAAVV